MIAMWNQYPGIWWRQSPCSIVGSRLPLTKKGTIHSPDWMCSTMRVGVCCFNHAPGIKQLITSWKTKIFSIPTFTRMKAIKQSYRPLAALCEALQGALSLFYHSAADSSTSNEKNIISIWKSDEQPSHHSIIPLQTAKTGGSSSDILLTLLPHHQQLWYNPHRQQANTSLPRNKHWNRKQAETLHLRPM